MYAIIQTGGKQYKVQTGDVLFLEKLDAQADEAITFGEVLAIGKDDGMVFGSPLVAGASVAGKVLKQGKGKKLTVFTYKPKKNQKRKLGHRQPYTKVEIGEITG
ncbi:MAG: 50S ribosomal protein L21 [Oscillospiraceae bacterium]|nr:50S ribosomal protein L21 [Oscillospiraceae bacterium]